MSYYTQMSFRVFCVIDVEIEIYSDAHIIIMGAIALKSQRSAKSFAYYYRLGVAVCILISAELVHVY